MQIEHNMCGRQAVWLITIVVITLCIMVVTSTDKLAIHDTAMQLRIQTWLRRLFRKPRLTNSYASSFRPRQLNVKPFIACVSN